MCHHNDDVLLIVGDSIVGTRISGNTQIQLNVGAQIICGKY